MEPQSMESLGLLEPNTNQPLDVNIDPNLFQNAETDNYATLQEGDVADADSDVEDLEQDIEKLNVSVRAFLASQHGPAAASVSANGAAISVPQSQGRTAPRGPRKAAEPRGDIKARLFKANRAFMMGDIQQAKDLVSEVIRINAETHQAWTTLASIFREEGQADRALMSMVYAAHLRPKDVQEWLKAASFALDVAEEHPEVDMNTARLCYSAAVSADPKNIEARLGRAAACHRLNQISIAIGDYKVVLAQRPLDLDVIRKLAETCMDYKQVATASVSAIAAYDLFFAHPAGPETMQITWYDVGIYTELLAYANRQKDAIFQLKALSRRLLGRQGDKFWDVWQADDREFDEDESRRVEVPEYHASRQDQMAYGLGLPKDLRIRLVMYRLTVEDVQEALYQLSYINPANPQTKEEVAAFPWLIQDLANQLFDLNLIAEAQSYYELLHSLMGEPPDALVLQQLGRCHFTKGENSAAEEYFLAAIEADADNIDARVELANLYSSTHEDEEALILVTEAIALQKRKAAELAAEREARPRAPRKPRNKTGQPRKPRAPKTSGVLPARYRPKRLVDPEMKRQEELERARRLSQKFVLVRDLKAQIRDGNEDLIPSWMDAAKELIDDFRSYRKFYSWDKYLKFLGRPDDGTQPEGPAAGEASNLDEFAERLSRAILLPQMGEGQEMGTRVPDFHEYQGIPFESWLDLFLDYAISLAASGQHEEAYRVCESAKDSTVFTVSQDNIFFIYIAWGACAVYAADEETCVSIARQIMREHVLSSDSFRLFSLLCRLCQSSISWYSSGPAQKFILRQIKAMDACVSTPDPKSAALRAELDVSPLMLYGHILFTSTSYVYAIHYFLRAKALDPSNPVINLSLGLGYIHYGLKRQSVNRQYLILQGLSFLLDYYRTMPADRADEANYGVARTFQLLGLQRLALEYYRRIPRRDLVARRHLVEGLEEAEAEAGDGVREGGERVVRLAAAYNMYVSYVMSGDVIAARDVVKDLVL